MMPPLALASRSIGAKTWQPWIGPHRLMPRVQCQSSIGASPTTLSAGADAGVVDHQRRRALEPAPAPRRRGPATSSSADDVAGDRDRLAAVVVRSRSTVRWAPTRSMSLTRPGRRGAASSTAKAWPMPLPAPVTTARASRCCGCSCGAPAVTALERCRAARAPRRRSAAARRSAGSASGTSRGSGLEDVHLAGPDLEPDVGAGGAEHVVEVVGVGGEDLGAAGLDQRRRQRLAGGDDVASAGGAAGRCRAGSGANSSRRSAAEIIGSGRTFSRSAARPQVRSASGESSTSPAGQRPARARSLASARSRARWPPAESPATTTWSAASSPGRAASRRRARRRRPRPGSGARGASRYSTLKTGSPVSSRQPGDQAAVGGGRAEVVAAAVDVEEHASICRARSRLGGRAGAHPLGPDPPGLGADVDRGDLRAGGAGRRTHASRCSRSRARRRCRERCRASRWPPDAGSAAWRWRSGGIAGRPDAGRMWCGAHSENTTDCATCQWHSSRVAMVSRVASGTRPPAPRPRTRDAR